MYALKKLVPLITRVALSLFMEEDSRRSFLVDSTLTDISDGSRYQHKHHSLPAQAFES